MTDTTKTTDTRKGLRLPCGCAARKDIMFGTGAGVPEIAILGTVLVLAFVAWKVTK